MTRVRESTTPLEHRKNQRFYILSGMIAVALGVITVVSMNCSAQSDEIFSIDLTRYSWPEMIRLAAADVHPPLYYVILKISVDILGGGDPFRRTLICQAVSVLSVWLLLLLAVTVVRRTFGRRVAVLFAGCLIGLPSLIHVNIQMRMYGWGMLFVTIAAVMSVFIMRRQDTRTTWTILLTSAIAACYSHYFCDVAIFYIYVLLLLWMIRYRRECVRILLVQAATIVIVFLPWLSVLFGQVAGVAEDHWLEQADVLHTLDDIKFLLSPYTNASIIRIPLALLFAAIIFVVFARALWQRQWDQVYLMSLVVCLMITGVTINAVFRPVYVARYAIPASGAFCLGLSIGIARLMPENLIARTADKRPLLFAAGAILVIMTISAIDILSYVKNQAAYTRNFKALQADLIIPAQKALEEGESVSIVTDSAYLHSAFAYYLPEATIYRPGWKRSDYNQRQSNPDNLAAYTEGMTLPSGEVWVVHSLLEDDELLQMVDVSEAGAIDACLEQTGMTIYRMDSRGNNE